MVVIASQPVYRGDQSMLGSVPRRGRHRLGSSQFGGEGAHDVEQQANSALQRSTAAQQGMAAIRRALSPGPAPRHDDWQAELENALNFNSFDNSFSRSHLCYEKEQAKLVDTLRPVSFAERMANPVSSDTRRITGRERLSMLRTALDSFGVDRSDMQKLFHEDMIGACARLIFKDDLESELDDLLLELGVEELHSEFMAITPRRFGKTYAVAMFVVGMMFAVEGLEQAIFSTGRRASQKLLELIYRFLCKIPNMRESIIKHNVETIWIRGPNGDQDVRKVFSYPSNVRISHFRSFSFVVLSASESDGPR